MESGDWRGEAWPGPEVRARQRLPRVEDLPAAENGYDRERVREAFESFYRHIAQLDSTLRALEAVEVFRDQAGELRKELRALKAAGWTQQPWPSYGAARSSPGLPESLPRFAIEAAFLIIVAVVVAVAGFDRLSIVLVMGLAWAIVGVVEWASSRERFARKPVSPPARATAEPAEPQPLRIVAVASPERAEAWEDVPAAEAAEDAEDELTVVGAAEAAEEAVAAAEPAVEAEEEPAAVVADDEPAAVVDEPAEVVLEPSPGPEAEAEEEVEEPEPDGAPAAGSWSWAADPALDRAREQEQPREDGTPRRRFWQRRKRNEDGYRFDPTQPRHVRVLPPAPSFDEQFPVEPVDRIDPWEEDLDLAVDEPAGAAEPDAEPAEPEPEAEHAYAEARPDGDRIH